MIKTKARLKPKRFRAVMRESQRDIEKAFPLKRKPDAFVKEATKRIITESLKLYSPHESQLDVHQCIARFRVVAFGRQSGKSTCGLNEILRHAWLKPGTTYWFVSPTFDQAKKQYRRLVGMLSPCWEVLLKKNQTELRVKLINQSVIEFKSGEVFDNLRGETLNGCVIDEYRDQPRGLWSRVIRPMLTTTKGWCLFVSTPNGFDAFYDLAMRAQQNKTGDWAFFEAPSTANPLFTQEEYESSKHEMSEAEFDQEINAKFRNIFSGRAYSSHGEWNKKLFSPFCGGNEEVCSKWLPVVIALDFNVNPMSWHLGQFRNEMSYWFDEIHIKDTNTEECAKELVAKLKELKARGVLNASPMVRICGDSTGNSRNTKATRSDYDLICMALDAAEITWEDGTPDSNPPVKQRVNTMNTRLRNAAGSTTLFYHPGMCPMLDRDFERVAWKEGAESILDQQKDKTLTHASDGVGYAVCVYSPIELAGQVGELHEVAAI
jgi:hypothetical protein